MLVFPGTAVASLPPLAHPTARERARSHPEPSDVQLDAAPINACIDAALAESAVGARLDTRALADLAQELTGHLARLLPLASARYRATSARDRDPVLGHWIGYLQRRLAVEPPDAHANPASALAWVQESARYARQTLTLVLAEETAEQRHAGVTRR
ncbi:hypothetical protein [Streptomyces sp. UNOC14_S4]|uniref:hypothetical protein n=1 Tax=Streptomyces sp. UNOC14_S4 TaxID=2872340 RepID=UPI001E3626B8|nr:hypothetical protein [Streptomyces sp. UNOC14_S4]MCC3766386.1 hypothetical protein [Streptomyces sp. UNOC14_S4]